MLNAFRHIVYACGYSVAGFAFMLRNETAARLEVVTMALAVLWLAVLGRPFSNFLVLLMLACILFAIEAVNTAIEVVADKLSPEQSNFAKIVKDLGSTAVFFVLGAGVLFLAAVTADSFGYVDL